MHKRVIVVLLLAFLMAGVAGAARLPSPRQGIVHERRAPADLQVLPALWEALASMLSRLKDRGTMDPKGGGHTWPGGKPLPEWQVGPNSNSIDATRQQVPGRNYGKPPLKLGPRRARWAPEELGTPRDG